MVEVELPETLFAVATTPDDEEHLCRLCLKHDEHVVEIFEEAKKQEAKQSNEAENLAMLEALPERLFELFQIKYEKSPSLPHVICERCLYMVRAFHEFREKVKKCETDLQVKLEELKSRPPGPKVRYEEYKRPGLNGCEGEFVPDENCEITEIDPNMEYESSDDDFSMESDSETELHQPVNSNMNSGESLLAQQRVSPAQPMNHNISGSSSEGMPPAQTTTGLMTKHAAHPPAAAAAAVNAMEYTTTMNEDFGLEFTVKNTFLCQYCDMAFTTQQDCVEHETRHDVAEPFLCNFCPQRYSSRQTLIFHIKELHDSSRPYVCALCNKGFGRRSDLKKHTIVHTGVRPFSCPVCGKSFSRNTNLTKHMRIHSSIKPHVCQQCPRSFSSAGELMRHARSHAETKPFQCQRCPASFARKDKLQLHDQAHYRRESEFLLNQSKSAAGLSSEYTTPGYQHSMENMVVPLNPFSGESELQEAAANPPYAHSLMAAQLPKPLPPPAHTAAHKPFGKSSHSRNYTCQICFKTFTRERDLQRHQALHLDSLFTCKQCGTGFSRREKLARHELEAHGPQYSCDYCRNTFHKRDEYELHMKIHELQQNVALTTHAAQNAVPVAAAAAVPPPAVLPPSMPNPSEMSFYSQMVPTMNLGFYSETRPEE